MIPEIDGQRKEWEQSEEWRQQKAEGERRKWEWEKLQQPLRSITRDGVTMTAVTGKRELPSAKDMDRLWGEAQLAVNDFQFYPFDQQGLERELADLERDAELMAKHEGVDYGIDD